jgi:putative peptide zinc metalloprotease protein
MVGLAALFAPAAVIYAVARGGVTIKHADVSLPFIIGGLLLHAIIHELSHALVGSYYGVKIREFGIALLYYFLPVAYTDRTDAYRLRDFNSRAAIAMAGPMFDLYGAGISAAASCLTSGTAAVNFRLLMWMQVITFISNLNPLMPGDGYHVLEAWFGALNFRRRAFSLLFRRLSWPLSSSTTSGTSLPWLSEAKGVVYDAWRRPETMKTASPNVRQGCQLVGHFRRRPHEHS